MAANPSDSEELRRSWRNRWLGSIQDFADAETQRRLWLDPSNTNPHYSFGEYYCCYFDDLNLTDGGYEWAVEEGLVRAEEAKAVKAFHSAARAYHEPTTAYDQEAILADPKCTEVVNAAKQAQAALLALIDDLLERRLLTRPQCPLSTQS